MRVSTTASNVLLAFSLFALHGGVTAQELACGSLENHYGPYDYRSAPPEQRRLVERPHFPPKVEFLRGGNTSITPGGDIAYTLRVFPNHPRALLAMMKLAEKEKRERPRDSTYTVGCWFERAERFRPEDVVVKSLFGSYLVRHGRKDEAIAKLDAAVSLGVDSPNDHYNIGLVYFEAGQYEKAMRSAQRAYEGGFPLPGLREKLKRVGKWRDLPQGDSVKTEAVGE